MKNQYVIISLVLMFILFGHVSAQESDLPDPELEFLEKQEHVENGRRFTTFRLTVSNWEKFPEELFEPAPHLPPCGRNNNASRTWIEIYNQKEKRIYGFCAIKSAKELFNTLAFSVPEGKTPPEEVFIVIFDREKKKFYRSKKVSINNN
jgi:hypothetical protein